MENKIFIFEDLFDAEEIEAFIKKTEKIFRASWEYKIWLENYTHREYCAATGLSRSEDSINIEVHHYYHTLYTWCEIIIDKMIDNELKVNSCYVSMILSDLHLNNVIPYLPLGKTYHEQLHKIGEYQFMKLYPNAENYLFIGDTNKANSIINEHINILKQISGKEKE